MTEPSVCADCGAKLTGLTCENCGASIRLAFYGFKVKKAPAGGYVLLNNTENPILTFQSLGSKTCSSLAKRTKAPIEVMERELASLAIIEPTSNMTDGETPSQADRMIEYALASELQVFKDERGEAYGYFLRDDVFVIYRVRSRTFKTWLAGLLWEYERKAPGNEAISSAINVLSAIAEKGDRIPLHNRVAQDGTGGIWFDMTNDKRQAIHITKLGWEIVDKPPILFRRYSHQKPVKPPIRGGTILPLLGLHECQTPREPTTIRGFRNMRSNSRHTTYRYNPIRPPRQWQIFYDKGISRIDRPQHPQTTIFATKPTRNGTTILP